MKHKMMGSLKPWRRVGTVILGDARVEQPIQQALQGRDGHSIKEGRADAPSADTVADEGRADVSGGSGRGRPKPSATQSQKGTHMTAIQELEERYSSGCTQARLTIVRGAGTRLWDEQGKEYIDLPLAWVWLVLDTAIPCREALQSRRKR